MNSGQNDHIVSSFDADLSKLDNMIAEMGGLAESQLSPDIEALCRRDTTAADRIVPADKRIDDLEEEIYEFTVKLLALRQPMAGDLRIVISAIKISSVIERIGDYAKNISKRTVGLDKSPSLTGAMTVNPDGQPRADRSNTRWTPISSATPIKRETSANATEKSTSYTQASSANYSRT